MTCPSSGTGHPSNRGVDRRRFLQAAVSIGGANALSACLSREDPESVPSGGANESSNAEAQTETTYEEGPGGAPVPGPDPADRDVSQHAWNEYLHRDQKGVPLPPRHHVLLLLDYVGGDVESDRDTVESGLQGLEEAYEWSSEGLLFTIGYSFSYFEEHDGRVPERLMEPRAISRLEDPEIDTADVCLHLASDNAHVVLAAEQAVRGEVSEVQGRKIEADISSVLELYDRRTGFIGDGLPAANQDVEGIPPGEPVPEESSLYMGFDTRHGLQEFHPDYDPDVTKVHNQAREGSVTIPDGPYEGGTTQQVSQIRLNLEDWYGSLDLEERAGRMFEAGVDVEHIGATGRDAHEGSRFDEEDVPEHVEEHGSVGHAEKLGRARSDQEPRILRRDFDSTDGGHARLHFVSLQEDIQDFVITRETMDGRGLAAEFEEIGKVENNGILEFIEVERRGNYLLPPVDKRALPMD